MALAETLAAKRAALAALDTQISQFVAPGRAGGGSGGAAGAASATGSARSADRKRPGRGRGGEVETSVPPPPSAVGEDPVPAGQMRSVLASTPASAELPAKRSRAESTKGDESSNSPKSTAERRRPSLQGSDKDKARNKRMFGFLMGTLAQAQKEAGNKSKAEEKFLEVSERLEEQARKEKEEYREKREQLFSERRAVRNEIFGLEQQVALDSWKETWQKHADSLLKPGPIRCKSDLPIFYIPAKHTPETRALAEETAKELTEAFKQKQTDHWKILPLPERRNRRGGEEEQDEDEQDHAPAAENGESKGEADERHDD